MVYGLIISAGKQTRFERKLPKVFSKLNETTVLDYTIKTMEQFCDTVYVVCSFKNAEYFKQYKTLVIDSGLGSGDAVYKAINLLHYNNNDTCFIQWGDCIHTENIYRKAKEYYNGELMVPCTVENFPSVQVKCDYSNRKIIEVLFSEYEDLVGFGYSDLGLYYGNAKKIFEYCESFADRFYNDNKEIYKSPHGVEFNFLDIFRYCRAAGRVVPIKNYELMTFDTEEELKEAISRYERLSSTKV